MYKGPFVDISVDCSLKLFVENLTIHRFVCTPHLQHSTENAARKALLPGTLLAAFAKLPIQKDQLGFAVVPKWFVLCVLMPIKVFFGV